MILSTSIAWAQKLQSFICGWIQVNVAYVVKEKTQPQKATHRKASQGHFHIGIVSDFYQGLSSLEFHSVL